MLGLHLLDVRHVLEAVAPIVCLRGAREVVDRDRVDPGLRESLRQLLEELVQTAHIGQHDHSGSGRLRGPREVGHELRPVGRGQPEVAVVGGCAGNRRQGWSCVISIAHVSILP